ncbi:MAG: HEAT repeat domain-containing protein [Ardenticatenaceae bacterium]
MARQRETRKTIASLHSGDEPIEEPSLSDLSNLTREEQALLDDAWAEIPVDMRRRLVTLMGEKADEDFQLDFTAVFRRGLQDMDAAVRQACVEGLWEDESITLIRPFLALLGDENHAVQACAATALARFVLQGELGYLSAERYQEIVQALVEKIQDPDSPLSVRRRAVEAIAYSSDDRVRDIIARAYEDASVEMRISAVFAMGRSADDYWRESVRGELWSENPALRYEAARAAGELADPQAVERLVMLLGDGDREVREMAIWALGQIGGSAAKRALKAVINGDQPVPLRRLARDSLAEMNLLDETSDSFLVDATLYDSLEEDNDDEERQVFEEDE